MYGSTSALLSFSFPVQWNVSQAIHKLCGMFVVCCLVWIRWHDEPSKIGNSTLYTNQWKILLMCQLPYWCETVVRTCRINIAPTWMIYLSVYIPVSSYNDSKRFCCYLHEYIYSCWLLIGCHEQSKQWLCAFIIIAVLDILII